MAWRCRADDSVSFRARATVVGPIVKSHHQHTEYVPCCMIDHGPDGPSSPTGKPQEAAETAENAVQALSQKRSKCGHPGGQNSSSCSSVSPATRGRLLAMPSLAPLGPAETRTRTKPYEWASRARWHRPIRHPLTVHTVLPSYLDSMVRADRGTRQSRMLAPALRGPSLRYLGVLRTDCPGCCLGTNVNREGNLSAKEA
ncbi:hypothetical protein BDV06DRAFT_88392 [Aspergillus oleicola]